MAPLYGRGGYNPRACAEESCSSARRSPVSCWPRRGVAARPRRVDAERLHADRGQAGGVRGDRSARRRGNLGNAGFVDRFRRRARRRSPSPLRPRPSGCWRASGPRSRLARSGGSSTRIITSTTGAATASSRRPARSSWRRKSARGAGTHASQDAEDRARTRSRSPAVTYRDAISIWLGDRRVDVFTVPGHTGGDSLVSVPDADVLFGGDLLQKRTVPNLADATTDAWMKTLDEIARALRNGRVDPRPRRDRAPARHARAARLPREPAARGRAGFRRARGAKRSPRN